MRGFEGAAARAYFKVLGALVRPDDPELMPCGRTRRPPRDPVNALLSFFYGLLRTECAGALEAVGLDPQVGFFHTLRPGRPSLALDLMEELRPVLADRLALTLVNRREVGGDDFVTSEGGAVHLSDPGRKKVITAYQEAKLRQITHPLLREDVSAGLLPHVQARLLARFVRNDIPYYPPYLDGR